MDFDDWLKAGNGAREDETLEDAVKKTVDSMYEGIDPIDFANRMFERDRNKSDDA
jgi:hypothetical protein